MAHTSDYKELTEAAESVIQNESIGFIFLHLPVPHPPGIYDRKKGTLGVRGSYIDNLALADTTIDALVKAIEKTAAANETTLILSSDHSWRVKLWRTNESRTAEDGCVSGGEFDPRHFLLVRFPDQIKGELRTRAFPELGIHGILEAMLKGEIHSENDLDAWLQDKDATKAPDIARSQSQ